MLYICPQCGHWIFSLGIAEAFAQAARAEYTQRCEECKIEMQVYKADERIKIIPKRARRAPQVLSYDDRKNKQRRKH